MTSTDLIIALAIGAALTALVLCWHIIRQSLRQAAWYRRRKGGHWLYYHDTGWMQVKDWQYTRARINRHPWAYASEWCGCCEDHTKHGAE